MPKTTTQYLALNARSDEIRKPLQDIAYHTSDAGDAWGVKSAVVASSFIRLIAAQRKASARLLIEQAEYETLQKVLNENGLLKNKNQNKEKIETWFRDCCIVIGKNEHVVGDKKSCLAEEKWILPSSSHVLCLREKAEFFIQKTNRPDVKLDAVLLLEDFSKEYREKRPWYGAIADFFGIGTLSALEKQKTTETKLAYLLDHAEKNPDSTTAKALDGLLSSVSHGGGKREAIVFTAKKTKKVSVVPAHNPTSSVPTVFDSARHGLPDEASPPATDAVGRMAKPGELEAATTDDLTDIDKLLEKLTGHHPVSSRLPAAVISRDEILPLAAAAADSTEISVSSESPTSAHEEPTHAFKSERSAITSQSSSPTLFFNNSASTSPVVSARNTSFASDMSFGPFSAIANSSFGHSVAGGGASALSTSRGTSVGSEFDPAVSALLKVTRGDFSSRAPSSAAFFQCAEGSRYHLALSVDKALKPFFQEILSTPFNRISDGENYIHVTFSVSDTGFTHLKINEERINGLRKLVNEYESEDIRPNLEWVEKISGLLCRYAKLREFIYSNHSEKMLDDVAVALKIKEFKGAMSLLSGVMSEEIIAPVFTGLKNAQHEYLTISSTSSTPLRSSRVFSAL